MGIGREYCCATTTEEYLKLAYRLVDDEYYYKLVREKIRQNSSKLFEQHESIREYQSALHTLVKRHHSTERAAIGQVATNQDSQSRTARLSAIQRRRLGQQIP